MTSERPRILIADDHPLIRRGMRTVLSAVSDFEVAGEAATGQEAVALAETLRPDVILMDLQMPDLSGIEATRAILAARPEVRILVVTLFQDDDSVFLALRAGARGYVLKDAEEEELIAAIRAVAGGAAMFSPAARHTHFHDPATHRQCRVVIVLEAGNLQEARVRRLPLLNGADDTSGSDAGRRERLTSECRSTARSRSLPFGVTPGASRQCRWRKPVTMLASAAGSKIGRMWSAPGRIASSAFGSQR